MKRATLILTAMASLAVAAHATDWKVYHDTDWVGYTVTYPSFLRLIPERVFDPNVDHVRWQNPVYASDDGEVQLRLHFGTDVTDLKKTFQDDIANHQNNEDTVSYSVIKDEWYVVSGVDQHGYDFYTKCYLTASGRYTSFTFSYPHEQHKIYDPMVSVIAKGFKPEGPL
jgi:hypothetical protein